MYIDAVPNRNSPPAILLRESYRENGKVKKRTLANLSQLPAEIIDLLRGALTGTLTTADASIQQTRSGAVYGTLYALNALAKQLGIVQALGNSRLAQLALFLILARLAHQGSRLSAVRWARDQAVKEVLGLGFFDEDDLYEALDWIGANQQRIENTLYRRYVRQHGQSPTLILYDVTSSYLEGQDNELAAYGYNRDGKKGKKQIVIGLLTAQDGEPLSVDVFEGNTSDPTTVNHQVDTLVQRFEVKDIVFVGDRGMIKRQGKKYLNGVEFKYITALTNPQIRKLINQQVIQPGLFDEQVAEVIDHNRRLILRCDPLTKRKERHRRDDKLRRLQEKINDRNAFVNDSKKAQPQAGLKALKRWIKTHKIAAFVELTLQDRTLVFTLDEQAKREHALLDGCYCIETDVPTEQLNKDAVHQCYKDLQQVERDFRSLKTGLLEVRPIFVRKAQRTRGHVFISMLSLKIARLINHRLKDAFGTTDDNPYAETLDSALAALSRLCLHHYTIADQELVALPRPDARQENLIAALKFNIKAPLNPSARCTQ